MLDGAWQEIEVDMVTFDNRSIIIGECKFRNNTMGIKELMALKAKAAFVPVKNRNVYFLLASKGGFSADLEESEEVILVDGV